MHRVIDDDDDHDSDKEWEEELEREIDSQVDAVFGMAKDMDGGVQPENVPSDITDEAFLLQALNSLNENMKKQSNKRRVNLPMFLTILAISVFLVRYTNPAIWMEKWAKQK